jgi:hypothetical protein
MTGMTTIRLLKLTASQAHLIHLFAAAVAEALPEHKDALHASTFTKRSVVIEPGLLEEVYEQMTAELGEDGSEHHRASRKSLATTAAKVHLAVVNHKVGEHAKA